MSHRKRRCSRTPAHGGISNDEPGSCSVWAASTDAVLGQREGARSDVPSSTPPRPGVRARRSGAAPKRDMR
jgi:hypothetical protein